MPIILAFPDRILHEAKQIANSLTLSEISQTGLDLANTNHREKAIPYFLALLGINKSDDTLNLLAMCCHDAALEQSKKLVITSDGEAYVNCAIAGFSQLIDGDNSTYDTFAARAAMYLLKAQLHSESSLLDEAEADCNKAIELGSPNKEGIRKQIASISYVRKQMPLSVEDIPHLDKVPDPQIERTSAILESAKQGFQSKYSKPLWRSLLDSLSRKALKDAEAYLNRGNSYYKKGKFKQAIEDYSQAISLNPKDAEAYFFRGLTYYKKWFKKAYENDLDRAIEDYTQAISLAPNYISAYNNRGFAYEAKGDLDHAIEDFSQVISLNPKNAQIYVSRGGVYFDSYCRLSKRSKEESALEEFDRSLEFLEQSEKELHSLENLEKGEERWRKESQINEMLITNLKSMEWLLVELKDYLPRNASDGKFDVERAIEDYKHARIEKLRTLKSYLDRAIEDYNQAISLNPKLAGAYTCRAYAYRTFFEDNLGDASECVGMFKLAEADEKKVQELSGQ